MVKVERLFLALWPEDQLQQAIYSDFKQKLELTQSTRSRQPGHHPPARLTTCANLHMTLVFLGNVLLSQRQCLETEISNPRFSSAMTSFQLTLDKPVFRAKQQILWLEASEIPEPLMQLVRRLRTVGLECGLELESRSFKAHVTIARKVKNRISKQALQSWKLDPFSWSVTEFALVASRTLNTGAEYTMLKRYGH